MERGQRMKPARIRSFEARHPLEQRGPDRLEAHAPARRREDRARRLGQAVVQDDDVTVESGMVGPERAEHDDGARHERVVDRGGQAHVPGVRHYAPPARPSHGPVPRGRRRGIGPRAGREAVIPRSPEVVAEAVEHVPALAKHPGALGKLRSVEVGDLPGVHRQIRLLDEHGPHGFPGAAGTTDSFASAGRASRRCARARTST